MERCPLGGGARIVYTEGYRESADTVWLSGHWVITPDRCEKKAVGDTLVLDGDPSVVFESEFRYIGFLDEGEYDLAATGAVTWRRNDGSSARRRRSQASSGAGSALLPLSCRGDVTHQTSDGGA